MKLVIANIEEVAEQFRSEYEARDGKFFLKMEGDNPALTALTAANAKIVEFRDKNISLLKEVDALRPLATKFDGIDPDEARAAVTKVRELGKKGIKDADDFEARVAATVENIVKPLREQITQSANETAAERRRADEFLLHSRIAETFTKAGGKAKAVDFVVDLAKQAFEVKDSTVAAKVGKFSVDKPGETLTIDEWVTSILPKEHDFVFEPSKGGGAPPVKEKGPSSPKPGQTLLKNPTPQQLGEYATDIAAGKVKIVYET